nr:MAG TPA: hypothetical protein [Bacteriophage sp.]
MTIGLNGMIIKIHFTNKNYTKIIGDCFSKILKEKGYICIAYY